MKKQKYLKKSPKKKAWIYVLVMALAVTGVAGAIVLKKVNDKRASMMPWEKEGRLPVEYTWEEYEALEGIYKDLFFESFETSDEFDQWMIAAGGPVAQETTVSYTVPWKEENGKKPSEYTWDEYQALDDVLKDLFFESFASADAFQAWLDQANSTDYQEETVPESMPWEAENATKVSEYTWEEYQMLDPEEKDAFFESFASEEDFDDWWNSVCVETVPETTEVQNAFENPEEHTWEEFMALTPEQQEAFFESFENTELFEIWMDANMPR